MPRALGQTGKGGGAAKQVAQFFALGLEVFLVVLVRLHADWHLLDDLESVPLHADDFFRVVGEQPDFLDAEVGEDLRADAVLTQIHRKAEFLVGLDGVVALLLELVSLYFRGQTDASALLAHVQDHPVAGGGNLLHRLLQLRPAIAAARAEHVAGEAFALHANERAAAGVHAALDEGEVVLAVDRGAIEVQVELAIISRHVDDLLAGDKLFAFTAKLDELLDGTDLEFVFFREATQLRQAGHRAVVVHDLANDPHRPAAGESGEIHCRLGVAGALQHTPAAGAQREHVPRLHQVVGQRGGFGQGLDGRGAVGGADAGGDALRGVDAGLEVGTVGLAVVEYHALDAELLQALRRGRHTDEAAAKLGHEVDRLGRGFLGGHDQVALVFAIGVIDDDDHLAARDVAQR